MDKIKQFCINVICVLVTHFYVLLYRLQYTYIYKVINSDYPSTNLLKFTNKPMHFQPRPRRTPPSAKVLIKKFCGGLFLTLTDVATSCALFSHPFGMGGFVNGPFILHPRFLQLLEIWSEKYGSRNLVREIWFEKSG